MQHSSEQAVARLKPTDATERIASAMPRLAMRPMLWSLMSALLLSSYAQPVHAEQRLRVMASNLTSGNGQSYDPGEGIRIMQGLQPDIVLIQEFNYGDDSDDDIRAMVDLTFGPDYSFFRESNGNIPNGIISRYPIVDFGEWDDKQVSDRDFAYARIDIPGPIDLWAISLHLLTSSSSERNSEAAALVKLIQANIPDGDYLVLGGDFNTSNRTESCITTLNNVVVTKGPYPMDQEKNDNTNEGRSKPYDWVLANSELDALKTPLIIGSSTYASGLVFDSSVYTPLDEVAPVELGDSHSKNMQHMGVARDFLLPVEDFDGDGINDVDGDCDDNDATVGPNFQELPDGKDNDCDGTIDEGTSLYDDDGDGFTEDGGDCNDANAVQNPTVPEVEDGLDNDCNGKVDDTTNAFDDDGDGYSENDGDCDDRNPYQSPGAEEIEDGIDNNCNNSVDEGFGNNTPTPTATPPAGGDDAISTGCACTQLSPQSSSPPHLGSLLSAAGLGLLTILRRRARTR